MKNHPPQKHAPPEDSPMIGLWSEAIARARVDDPATLRFMRFGTWTIVLIFLLILAGGIVRATGSGMGCPDWPTCFGRIVPPTDVSQLPADYQTRYNVHGHGVEPFNVAKTWIEYINRLLGAVSGLFVFGMVVLALPLWPKLKVPLVLSVIGLLLMGLQGWLGAKVVDSNLDTYKITLHMMLALVILFVLVTAVGWHRAPRLPAPIPKLNLLLLATFAFLMLVLGQIVLGTQVREGIDVVAKELNYTQRDLWPDQVGLLYYIHRSVSLVLLIGSVGYVWMLYQYTRHFGQLYFIVSVLFMVLGIEIVIGIMLGYAGMPAFAQPLHLLGGSLLAVVVFVIFMILFKQRGITA